MTTDDYITAETAWIKEVGLKEGDRVLVVGSPSKWDEDDQAATVGQVGIVMSWRDRDEALEGGVLVAFGEKCPCGNGSCGQGYYYPFYLLAKVEEND